METYAVTQLLDAARRGDGGAAERLWQAVHHELREMAASHMAREHGPRTLQPTALVNEVYLRIFGGNGDLSFENRRHFFAAAGRAMHQILVDDARTRGRLKRGGTSHRAEPGGAADHPLITGATQPSGDTDPAEVLAVDEALAKLGAEQPELVEIVRLRYFVGLTLDETADAIGISRRTVATRWRLAKAWLYEAMTGEKLRFDKEDNRADDRTVEED